MNLELVNKVAIVTGGARGIGREIASILAREGSMVIIADIDEKQAANTAEKISSESTSTTGGAKSIFLDVMKEASVTRMVQEVVKEHERIDILINSAGYISIAAPNEIDETEWDRVMDTNARGVFFCCKAVMGQMIKQKKGKILSISSQASKLGYPYESHYSASKAAVDAFTRSLAIYLADHNINVNAICPGSIDTEMNRKVAAETARVLGISFDNKWEGTIKNTPLKRKGTVEDVANMAVFLVSDKASFVTGQTVNVTGGRVMH